jgi:hypothetical protein
MATRGCCCWTRRGCHTFGVDQDSDLRGLLLDADKLPRAAFELAGANSALELADTAGTLRAAYGLDDTTPYLDMKDVEGGTRALITLDGDDPVVAPADASGETQLALELGDGAPGCMLCKRTRVSNDCHVSCVIAG